MTDAIQETETGYLVTVPLLDGFVRMAFEQIEQVKNRAIECELTVWQEIPGQSTEPFSAHLSLLSLSNRETYRRNLDDAYGKGNWTTILNRGCNMVKAAWSDRDPSYYLQDAPEEKSLPSLLPPWLASGPTILFGQGGSAKTYLALSVALSVASGAPFLGSEPLTGDVLYVDYEADGPTLRKRLKELAGGCGLNGDRVPIHYWHAGGVALHDMVPGLRRKVQRDNIKLLIIDSAALAAGGEPERAETAIRYFNALGSLSVPSLTIAHETKQMQDRMPFGSVFWTNSARCTWNVKLEHEEAGSLARLGLFNRKANNSAIHPPVGILVRWEDGEVTIQREELDSAFERELPIRQRIAKVLSRGAMSRAEISEETGADPDTVRRTLARYPDWFVRISKDEWGVKGHASRI